MKLTGRRALVTGVAAGIGEAGFEASWVEVDVADEVAVEKAVSQLGEALGGFDILVNNAGLYMGEYSGPCAVLERVKWRRLLHHGGNAPRRRRSRPDPLTERHGVDW